MNKGDINMVTGGGMFADAPPSLMIKIMGFFMKITGLGDFETFTPDILLNDNQSLKEYGLDATVLHTPDTAKAQSAYIQQTETCSAAIYSVAQWKMSQPSWTIKHSLIRA